MGQDLGQSGTLTKSPGDEAVPRCPWMALCAKGPPPEVHGCLARFLLFRFGDSVVLSDL